MSTKREPLLSDEQLSGVVISPEGWKRYETEMGNDEVRNIYEAARQKDAERIEQLEELCRALGNGLDEMMRPANRECEGAHCTGCWKDINRRLVKMLYEAGFKPAQP